MINGNILATVGISIRPCKWLHPLPRMEKERFSGGRNLSAIDRNRAKVAAARSEAKVVHIEAENTLIVPDWILDEVKLAMGAL